MLSFFWFILTSWFEGLTVMASYESSGLRNFIILSILTFLIVYGCLWDLSERVIWSLRCDTKDLWFGLKRPTTHLFGYVIEFIFSSFWFCVWILGMMMITTAVFFFGGFVLEFIYTQIRNT